MRLKSMRERREFLTRFNDQLRFQRELEQKAVIDVRVTLGRLFASSIYANRILSASSEWRS